MVETSLSETGMFSVLYKRESLGMYVIFDENYMHSRVRQNNTATCQKDRHQCESCNSVLKLKASTSSPLTFLCISNDWKTSPKRHKSEGHLSIVGRSNVAVSVRLEGGYVPWEGRVMVTRGGLTGTVCDDNFDNNDARVVCRMMGLM